MTMGYRLPLALALVLFLSLGWATTYRELTLAEMFEATEVAFVGTVASVSVDIRDGEPWTSVEFEVVRHLAGPSEESRLTLGFLGGDPVTGDALRVSGMPSFNVGDSVIILAYDDPYYSPIVGFNQGLWRLVDGVYQDEGGRRLGVSFEGELELDGDGSSPNEVIDAVARSLEARQ